MIEVAGLHVEVVRLQVAELRRHRVEAVVRQRDGLGVLQLREHAGREDVLVVRRVALAGADASASRRSPARSAARCARLGRLPTACSAPSDGRAGRTVRRRLCAVNSSLVARNNFVRKHWSSVRQLSSPGSADRSELMLWVATIGIRRACRDNAKVRSSPVGSVSPTVANAWYSSQTNRRSRQVRSGCAAILGIRWSTARWKSSLSITPSARARPGFRPTGKVQGQDVARLEQFLERRSGRGSPGFGGDSVRASWRAERAVDGRVVVEERQEDDDALRDGRAQTVVEAAPPVSEPAVDGVELMLPLDPCGAFRAPHLERNLLLVQGRLQLGARTDAPSGRAVREPVRPGRSDARAARSSRAERRSLRAAASASPSAR